MTAESEIRSILNERLNLGALLATQDQSAAEAKADKEIGDLFTKSMKKYTAELKRVTGDTWKGRVGEGIVSFDRVGKKGQVDIYWDYDVMTQKVDFIVEGPKGMQRFSAQPIRRVSNELGPRLFFGLVGKLLGEGLEGLDDGVLLFIEFVNDDELTEVLSESVYMTSPATGKGFHLPTPAELERYKPMHLGQHFDRIYGQKVAAFAAEMQKKYEKQYPRIVIRGWDKTHATKMSDFSKKHGPEFKVSVRVSDADGDKTTAPKIAKEIARALTAKMGGKAFKGRYQTTYLGSGGLAPVDGWMYTIRYYPHADKMKDDPAFQGEAFVEAVLAEALQTKVIGSEADAKRIRYFIGVKDPKQGWLSTTVVWSGARYGDAWPKPANLNWRDADDLETINPSGRAMGNAAIAAAKAHHMKRHPTHQTVEAKAAHQLGHTRQIKIIAHLEKEYPLTPLGKLSDLVRQKEEPKPFTRDHDIWERAQELVPVVLREEFDGDDDELDLPPGDDMIARGNDGTEPNDDDRPRRKRERRRKPGECKREVSEAVLTGPASSRDLLDGFLYDLHDGITKGKPVPMGSATYKQFAANLFRRAGKTPKTVDLRTIRASIDDLENQYPYGDDDFGGLSIVTRHGPVSNVWDDITPRELRKLADKLFRQHAEEKEYTMNALIEQNDKMGILKWTAGELYKALKKKAKNVKAAPYKAQGRDAVLILFDAGDNKSVRLSIIDAPNAMPTTPREALAYVKAMQIRLGLGKLNDKQAIGMWYDVGRVRKDLNGLVREILKDAETLAGPEGMDVKAAFARAGGRFGEGADAVDEVRSILAEAKKPKKGNGEGSYQAKTPLEKALAEMIRGQSGLWVTEPQMKAMIAELKKKGITKPGKQAYDDIARVAGAYISKHKKEHIDRPDGADDDEAEIAEAMMLDITGKVYDVKPPTKSGMVSKRPSKGTPTDTNLFALNDVFGNRDEVPNQLNAPDVPHIRRMVKAKCVEVRGKKLKLTALGKALLKQWQAKNPRMAKKAIEKIDKKLSVGNRYPTLASKVVVHAGPLQFTKAVRDIAQASKVVRDAIEDGNYGFSEVGGENLATIYAGTKKIGTVSYNGRVWTMDKKPLWNPWEGMVGEGFEEDEEVELTEAKRALGVARNILKALPPNVQRRVLDPKMTDISATQTNLVAVKNTDDGALGWQATVRLVDGDMVTVELKNVSQGKPARAIGTMAAFKPAKPNIVAAASWIEKHVKPIMGESVDEAWPLEHKQALAEAMIQGYTIPTPHQLGVKSSIGKQWKADSLVKMMDDLDDIQLGPKMSMPDKKIMRKWRLLDPTDSSKFDASMLADLVRLHKKYFPAKHAKLEGVPMGTMGVVSEVRSILDGRFT